MGNSCCPSDSTVCPGGQCCLRGRQCCAGACCETDNARCCNNGVSCADPATQKCCSAGTCAADETCCGKECCLRGSSCGNDGYCYVLRETEEPTPVSGPTAAPAPAPPAQARVPKATIVFDYQPTRRIKSVSGKRVTLSNKTVRDRPGQAFFRILMVARSLSICARAFTMPSALMRKRCNSPKTSPSKNRTGKACAPMDGVCVQKALDCGGPR